MTKTRIRERIVWSCAVTILVAAAGCAPIVACGRAAGSKTTASAAPVADPSLPQPSVVSLGPDGPPAVGVSSAIRRVTVYSDRALVVREARVQISSEPQVYALRNLPGWVDESSVRLSTSAGRIIDVGVQRSHLARATDEGYRRAESESRALADRMAALDDEIKVLDAQVKQVEDIKAFSLEKLNRDVVVANVGVGSYGSVVDFIGEKLRETARARRAVETERAKLQPEIEASKRRLDDLRGLTQLEETTVYVTLQSAESVAAAVQLAYMLPGATWEPAHELRVSAKDPASVEVTSFAVVTQASGEDWTQADLTFSTQSSTASVRIPELEALTLGDTKAATQILERQSAAFSRAETAFQDQNRLWNQRLQSTHMGGNFEAVYRSNFDYLKLTQTKTVQIFQSLQQRGTTAQFGAMSAANVRADGRSVRVPIGRSHLKATHAIVAAPERSLNAARTLDMLNETGQPLLPGSVALYQGGTFLGMTGIDFVADGERFALFSGVEDQIKLSRSLDRKHSSLVRRQRTLMQLAFVVTVENLASKPMHLTLADRIPVSEDREIVISGVQVTPDAKPDSKGILHWALSLQPKEKRTFEIRYQIEYPPTLVLDMKRSPTPEPPAAPAHPSRSVAPTRYDLRKEIEVLEKEL